MDLAILVALIAHHTPTIISSLGQTDIHRYQNDCGVCLSTMHHTSSEILFLVGIVFSVSIMQKHSNFRLDTHYI